MCVRVCICECVGLYVRVGFFIVPGGYGFGKANLGLRALGPCQAHQQISYAIRYRTTAAFNAHMRKHANLFFLSTVIHSRATPAMTHCTLEPVAACVSHVIPVTKLLIYYACSWLKDSCDPLWLCKMQFPINESIKRKRELIRECYLK